MLHPRPRSKSLQTAQYPRRRFEQLSTGDERQACRHTSDRQQYRPIPLAVETRLHLPTLPQRRQFDLGAEEDEQSAPKSIRACDGLSARPAPSCGPRYVLATHRFQARRNVVCVYLFPGNTNSGDLAASSRQRYLLRERRYRKQQFHSAPIARHRLFGAQEGPLKPSQPPIMPSLEFSAFIGCGYGKLYATLHICVQHMRRELAIGFPLYLNVYRMFFLYSYALAGAKVELQGSQWTVPSVLSHLRSASYTKER